MKQVRTLDFLPEIFRTETNSQFLNSTLDVLTNQPRMSRVEGFVGNKYGYAVEPNDKYVVEPTKERANYQLSPSLVFLEENTSTARDFIDYPGILSALKNAGNNVKNVNSLFSSDFYSWDSFADLDKMVNYSEYYWLPLGPDPVAITDRLTTYVCNVDRDIVGQTTYTSVNGVEFVNGLKVVFNCTTVPASYQNQQYYVEGVGTAITLIPVAEMLSIENPGNGIYVPWDKNPWDTTPWSVYLYIPLTPDYLTISRNSRDRNAWSRGNRWFNQAVLDTTIKFNGVVSENPNNVATRAQRPIIEFQGNLSLWDSGSISAGFVDFIDSVEKDPLSNIAGDSSYVINEDGTTVTVTNGSRVIFTNATDPAVRKQVYVVSYVPATDDNSLVVALTPEPGVTIINGSQAYVISGPGDYAGNAWRWDDSVIWTQDNVQLTGAWLLSQQKSSVNQAPLFDIFNVNGISLGNDSFYPDTTFAGCKLLSYAPGTGGNDPVLGFPISYTSVTNLGDINFDVNMNSDTFTYTSNSSSVTQDVSIGFVHYSPIFGDYIKRNGWVKAAAPSVQYQVFTFDITKEILENNDNGVVCDIVASRIEDTTWIPTQVYYNGSFVDTSGYTVERDQNKNTTTIRFNQTLVIGDQVSVLLISDQVSETAYYAIPANLQNNPFNSQIKRLNNGDIRNHYSTIFTNAPGVTGQQFGFNNVNNLPDLTAYGTAIIQNSASLALPMMFLRNPAFNLVNSLQYSSDEYIDYKNTIVDIANNGDYSIYSPPSAMLDDIIYQITSSKSSDGSFFWSDMLPSGSPYAVNTYDFGASVTSSIFPLSRVYDFTSANYYGLILYITRVVNNVTTYIQLVRDVDYSVSPTLPSVTVTADLLANDKLTIKEYNQTYGSYVPNTPSKLGLYQKTIPTIYLDNTYTTPTWFLVGHDGSYNKLYGTYNSQTGQLTDIRDMVLFEFEKRVYNNIKVSGQIPLTYADVFPGQFRNTGITRDDLMPVYSRYFLSWAGKNRIDYKTQYYNKLNDFTYNYNKSTNRLTGEVLQQGYWRGIYRWLYDTANPANAPWEMLGYTSQPTWWTSRYGVAPYTSGNTLMWQDLANGYDWNDGVPSHIGSDGLPSYINPAYVRPQLLQILPVDASGNLLSPFDSIVGNYDELTFKRSWIVGDQGPAESSYLKSSSWPFDLMKLLSIFSPVKFYNLMVDRDDYKYDADVGQYLFNDRYHLIPQDLVIYGNGVSKNSYINWVVDYMNQVGENGGTTIETTLNNIDVRLTYRLASFSDKQYLKFLIERSTPTSITPRLLIPDDSYDVLLYDDVPSDTISYSSVIIQKTTKGYTVWGNSVSRPYFETAVPQESIKQDVTVGGTTVRISKTYKTNVSIPVAYGTEFYSVQGVSEFLNNYGAKLIEQGVLFQNVVDGTQVDWLEMTKEFLNWSNQGWEVGSTISLNPNATLFNVYRSGLVVQPLTLRDKNFVMNQNMVPLQPQNMAILRNNEEFSIKVLSVGDSVAYTNLNLSSIEHAIVFSNSTTFGDTIYDLTTGLRQNRVVMYGSKSAEWTGYINAQGFIINSKDVQTWTQNGKYPKGQIVKYKDNYWSANTLIEPSDVFDYSKWTGVNYDEVKAGLLPNPSTMAYESTKFYDIYQGNLETDQDLLAFGLIGFRPRQYLSSAELSDISQVNVYINLIKSKGTNLSADAFRGSTVIQGTVDYTVKENWAIKSGDFGGVLNSNFVEFILSQNQLNGNPSIIGFTSAQTAVTQSDVNQSVNISEIINYGRAPRTANFLPVMTSSTEDGFLPTAGYVNLDDCKVVAYSFDDLNLTPEQINTLYTSDYVWVASYRGSWNVFQPQGIGAVVTTVTNNLDGTINVTFNAPHGLKVNDNFIVANFNEFINGYLSVSSVVNLNTVKVNSNLSKSTLTLTGEGTAMKLISRRFAQPSDATVPDTQIRFQKRLSWIDNDINGDWKVLATDNVYEEDSTLGQTATNLGTSVAYSETLGSLATDNTGLLYRNNVSTTISIGDSIVAVGTETQTIDKYVYGIKNDGVRIWTGTGTTTTLVPITNARSFTVSKDRNWLYIANTSGVISVFVLQSNGAYTQVSTLTGPTGEGFGASMATNIDGSKLIIGSPNKTISGLANAGIAYIYSRASETFQATGSNVFTVSSTTGGNALVYVNSVLQTSGVTVSGTTVTFATAPATGSIVTINYGTLTLQQTLQSDDPHDGALFGNSVTTNKYGAEVFIGIPYEFNTIAMVEGAVYRYTNAGQRYGTVVGEVTGTQTGTLFIDGYKVIYNGDAATIASQINSQEPTNVIASADGTKLTITTKAGTDNTPNDIVDIVGATAADLTKLGISSYIKTQVITSPDGGTNTAYGFVVAMNQEMPTARDSVIVSAKTANALEDTTFDFVDNLSSDDTIFDNGTTTFIDTFVESGAVYQYDYLKSDTETIDNPGKYVFGQYCNPTVDVDTVRGYGTSIAFNAGVIIIGDPTYNGTNGRVLAFKATTNTSSWYTYRQESVRVDVNKLNNISIYDTKTNDDLAFLEYIDPIQGKMLSVVETNIDFISQVDPAQYSNGVVWGPLQVGKVWLDTTNIRMMNYNQADGSGQSDNQYNSSNWGKAFPGSTADIYTWIESNVTPVDYVGSGFVVSFDNYTTTQVLDRSSDRLISKYYFWVKNFDLIPPGKNISPLVLSQYVLNPINSGISYLAALNPSTISLYNTAQYIQSNSSALHLGYSSQVNGDQGHQNWVLIQNNTNDSFLPGKPLQYTGTPTGLYLKYLNSFMGAESIIDSDPNVITVQNIPSSSLPLLMKYGTSFNPSQSMFVDRQYALQNFVDYANNVLNLYPIVETRGTFFLYQTGQVRNVSSGTTTNFDTTDYWQFKNWWAPGFSDSTKIVIEVPTYTDLLTLGQAQYTAGVSSSFVNLEEGLIARVKKNGQGVSEVYEWTSAGGWTRVGLQNGTIEILPTLYTTVDPIPSMEIYFIVRWVTEQVYVDNLAMENNESLILMFKLIQSQSLQQNNYLPWLNKTSLVDVNNVIRPLLPYKKFQRDNLELVSGYLNEVKPYHVYIKGYVMRYTKTDEYTIDPTDFDLPSEYNVNAGTFISPQLVYEPSSETGQYLPSNPIWTTDQYKNWFNNYGLSIDNSEELLIAVTNLTGKWHADKTYSGSATGNTGTTSIGQYVAITNSDYSIQLGSVGGLPDSGTVVIDSEEMKYGSVNRETNTLNDVTRGANGTVPASHEPGSTVYVKTSPVVVVDTGRGYTEQPAVTAYIDTDVYPEPRTAAAFTSNIGNGEVFSITVNNPGSGYAVAPELRIEPSPISDSWLSNNVDIVLDQITLTGHPFINGDCVVFSGTNVTTGFGLSVGGYYYVGVIDANTIALYENYADAMAAETNSFKHDIGRVKLEVQSAGTLNVTARAYVYTSARPVRNIKVSMKFDRTSFRLHPDENNAVNRIQNFYQPSVDLPGFESPLYVIFTGTINTTVPQGTVLLNNGIRFITMNVGVIGALGTSNKVYLTSSTNDYINPTSTWTFPSGTQPSNVISATNPEGGTIYGDYSQLMTGMSFEDAIILDPSFTYGKTYTFATADVATNTITMTIDGIVGSTIKMLFIQEWPFNSDQYGINLNNGGSYWVRKINSNTVALYITENEAFNDVSRIELPVTGKAALGGQLITGSYDVVLTNNGDTTDAPYIMSGGTFSGGYGPEEMVPAIVSDTINITMTTKPGSTWNPLLVSSNVTPYNSNDDINGYTGFNVVRISEVVDPDGRVYFNNVTVNPTMITVYATPTTDSFGGVGRVRLVPGRDYTITWLARDSDNRVIQYVRADGYIGQTLDVVINEFGGANQWIRSNSTIYPLRDVGNHSEIFLDVAYNQITLPEVGNTWYYETVVVYVNGDRLSYGTDFTVEPQLPIDSNNPYNLAKIVFTNEYDPETDFVSFVVTQNYNNNSVSGISIPETQWFTGRSGTGIQINLDGFLGDNNVYVTYPTWNSSTQYVEGDVVTYNSQNFVCVENNQNQQPSTTSIFWSITPRITNLIVEINGQRIGYSSPNSVNYIANNDLLSYAVPIYSMADFNINNLEVQVDGVTQTSGWTTNYNYTTKQPEKLDADWQGSFGYLDDGTPFDTQTDLMVIFGNYASIAGKRITLTYTAGDFVTPPEAYTVTVNPDQMGGVLTLNVPVTSSDWISVTSFNRTGQQSITTQVFSDVTISTIVGVTEQFNTPVTVTTSDANNLEDGNKVTINGNACPDLDGQNFYVSVVNNTTVQLYYDSELKNPVLIFNTNPLIGGSNRSYIQAVTDNILYQSNRFPLLLDQPDYVLDNVDRLWVTVERGNLPGVRNYIAPEYLRLVDNVLAILMPIDPSDAIVVTSMIPTVSPDETRLRINNTWDTLTNTANSPLVYRENENTRTFLTVDSAIVSDSFTVFDPYKLVSVKTVEQTITSGYLDIQGVNTAIITSIVVRKTGAVITDYRVSVINNSILRLTFTGSTTGLVSVTIAEGNTVIINSEQIVFTEIDLDTGTVSGLKRGMTGTITNLVLEKYSVVQSVLEQNKMSSGYYDQTWYNDSTPTLPLQLTSNAPADFLNTEF